MRRSSTMSRSAIFLVTGEVDKMKHICKQMERKQNMAEHKKTAGQGTLETVGS